MTSSNSDYYSGFSIYLFSYLLANLANVANGAVSSFVSQLANVTAAQNRTWLIIEPQPH